MKFSKKDFMQEDTPEWNMAQDHFKLIHELKRKYAYYMSVSDIENAIIMVLFEIDLVSTDFGQDLYQFRKEIDILYRKAYQKNITPSLERELKRLLIILVRKVWDKETELDLTRPKNRIDYSNTPVAQLNNR